MDIPLPLDQAPAETWAKVHWWMDSETRGRSVRLVAIDRQTSPTGWLGFSNPRSFSLFSLLRFQSKSAFYTIAAYLLQFGEFLLPGFALAAVLAGKQRPPPKPLHLVMVVIVTSATLGYLSFWAFFFSHRFGGFLSYAIYVVSAGLLLVPSMAGVSTIRATAKAIAQPFLGALLAGLCYISFYFLFTDPFSPGVEWAGNRFFLETRPGDNAIPLILADRIYHRQPVRPFCCQDWLSSDRPPLQSGIVLLERPVVAFVTPQLSYELLSSALQCLWICGVWCLLTSIGASERRIRQVLGFLVFSGFLFYNSVYTWPKLLSAALVFFLLSLLFDLVRDRRVMTYFDTVLAGTCFGLLLMAHPGATFSLPVCGIFLLRFRPLFPLRRMALGLLIAVAFYLPWSAYQRFVDPPGNRLLKMYNRRCDSRGFAREPGRRFVTHTAPTHGARSPNINVEHRDACWTQVS